MIQVSNVSKSYKDQHVLKDISFKLKKGKITAVLGHNGAGKTTLIRSILKLTNYNGDITYDFDEADLYKQINVQMQTSSYEQNAKVKEICELYKNILNVDVDINKMLKAFDLLDFKDSYANTLSGGEQQKLSLLLTIINKPKVIIYDEITTGLDVIARKKIWKLLKKIQRQYDLTVLLTSHFLEEIEYLADELIVLEAGEIKSIGTVNDFIDEMYHGMKQVKFTTSDTDTLDEVKKEYENVIEFSGSDFMIELPEKDEQKIIKNLYDLGVEKVTSSSYSFEDAFMKRFGYKIDEEGRSDNERDIDFF